MTESICPHCKREIYIAETIDSYADGNVTEYFCRGECSICGRKYRWKEIYLFSNIIDLEEIE